MNSPPRWALAIAACCLAPALLPGTAHAVVTLIDEEEVIVPSHEVIDDDLIDRGDFDALLDFATMIAPKLTIQGGTREILRGIIARGLGLR